MALAGKKRFNILIVPPTSGDTIRFTVPRILISLSGITLVSVALAFGFLLLDYIQGQDVTQRLEALKVENAFLQNRLVGMKSSMATFGQYVSEVEQTEKRIRMVFGLPFGEEPGITLGIGGFPPTPDSLASPYRRLAYDTEANLTHLLRRASFERNNFDDIYKQMVVRKDQLDHTPSLLPTQGYYASGFGMRRNPFTGENSLHRGVDFAAPLGTPVIAPADGQVVSVDYSADFGKTLVIDHGYGVRTIYCHLSRAKVKVGQKIKRGEGIAAVGDSGRSTGPHLHYEVYVEGTPVNPMNFIYDIPSSSRLRL